MVADNSPEAQLLKIIANKETVKEADVFKLFDQLAPVEPEFLLDEWSGAAVETGHMTSKWCEDVNFAGKTFNTANDVDPVWVFSDKGDRVLYAPSGKARIREVKYRGVVTATLIYNGAPTMDYFRKIDENTILSAADNINKPVDVHGTFFFYLKRGAHKLA